MFSPMLNKNVKSEHPYLILDFRGNAFRFPLLSMMLAVDLSVKWAFITLRCVLFIPPFFKKIISDY